MTQETRHHADDLRRVINDWRMGEYRRTKRANRPPIAPSMADPVDDWLVRCAWVLCTTYGGAHHVPRVRVGARFLEVCAYGDLATADGTQLTRIVLLAHEAAVRVSISPCNQQYVYIHLHPRARTPSNMTNHPTLEAAAAAMRERCPSCPVAIPTEDRDAIVETGKPT